MVWLASAYLFTQGNGLRGVPKDLAVVTGFGGAVSMTALSACTIYRLRRKYRAWPFRDGPAAATTRATAGHLVR